jgi:2-(1,2-epoxy-1,2-dihydrophenyl)acetyl-CoA isomerase
MRDENLPGNAARMGDLLMDGLRRIQADNPVIGDLRGLGLMVACDLVIAAESARFIEVFVRRGLVPDGGGAYLLPRLVGVAKAKELIFAGTMIPAQEALGIGLVNRVVPDDRLLPETLDYARMLLKRAPQAIGLAKRLLNVVANVDQASGLVMEGLAQSILIKTEDHQEGLRAFRDKRKPQFTGK